MPSYVCVEVDEIRILRIDIEITVTYATIRRPMAPSPKRAVALVATNPGQQRPN